MQWTQDVILYYVMAVTSLLTSSGVLGTRMDQATKDYILKVHNDYRAKEGSSNIPKLVWNETLEQQADEWSRGCAFQHKGMGENLAWNSKTTLPESELIDNAMKKFYDEKLQYSYGRHSCGPASCHYTQLVWAATTDVGCASQKCPSLRNSGWGKEAWFLVCRYNPEGNWNGQKPFLKGAACSACANDNAQCENGLCVGGTPKPVECKDDRKECPEWAGRGECQNNKSYMSKSCQKSCSIC